MKAGLVGPSYQERSLPFDAQRTINMYPVIDETKRGKEVSALYGTPGLLLFCNAGTGPGRGLFCSSNGRAFSISGNALWEITSSGTVTNRGYLSSFSGNCTIDENPSQMFICDGTLFYVFTYATNAFAQVMDADLPASVGTTTFLDGYAIVNKNNTGSFYISAINDATSWDSLDFATAESSPDNLVRVLGALGQLWLFGERTTEIWYNSGDVDFPFTRVSGAKMETGCAAAHTVIKIDNSIFWLGKDNYGKGIVYRAVGFSPQRISTHAIEYAISQVSDLSNIRGWSYQQDGHAFYALTGGGLYTTLVYDPATNLWHERATLESDGTFSTHKATAVIFAFNKHFVSDKTNGNIYEMSQDYFSDNGETIKRQRTFTHINNEGKRFRIRELRVDFESGVGLISGQGNNPMAALEVSKDGGRTWSREYEAQIGPIGERFQRCRWRRLGLADQFTFRVSITDPVKTAICGSYFS